MNKKQYSKLQRAEIFNILHEKGFSIYKIGELNLFGIENPSHIAKYLREYEKIKDNWLNKKGKTPIETIKEVETHG